MLEKLNLKTITTKIAGHLFFTLVIVLLPPPSLGFLLPSIGVGAITIVSLIFALRRRNAGLYLLYYLGSSIMLIFLLGLRFWDISIGLSWILMASLLPGLALAALFPFMNRSMSEFVYQEQVAPQTKIGRLIFMLTLGIMPVIGVLGAAVGRNAALQRGSIVFIVAGFVAYLTTIVIVQSGFHMYASGRFERWLEN